MKKIIVLFFSIVIMFSCAIKVVASTDIVFTQDSQTISGGKLEVNEEEMKDMDSAIYNAYIEKNIKYSWYLNGALINNEKGKTLTIRNEYAGKEIKVKMICGDLELESTPYLIEQSTEENKTIKQQTEEFVILSDILPDGIVGEQYGYKLTSTGENVIYSLEISSQGVDNLNRAGLTLTTDGEITGTLIEEGTFTFIIYAQNENGSTSKKFTLKVNPKPIEPEEVVPTIPDDKPTKKMKLETILIIILSSIIAILIGVIIFLIVNKSKKTKNKEDKISDIENVEEEKIIIPKLEDDYELPQENILEESEEIINEKEEQQDLEKESNDATDENQNEEKNVAEAENNKIQTEIEQPKTDETSNKIQEDPKSEIANDISQMFEEKFYEIKDKYAEQEQNTDSGKNKEE